MKTITTLTAFILLLLTSCADTKNNKNIIGSWHAVAWEANGKPLDRNVTTTNFTFTDKGAYTFENAGNIEDGTYKVEIDNLFTTAKGKQEIMVKIIKATNDSLIFDMNNGGQSETITMLKKK
jgi:Lipocalin-like domain